MKIEMSHDFSYPAETVWAMLHDPASHVEKFERAGHQDIEVIEQEVEEYSLRIGIRRTVEMEIPSVAKKFIQPTNVVTSNDYWEAREDDTYGGEFTVDIAGVPASTKGITSLEPTGKDSCRYTLDIDVKVNIPLVGDRIAKAIRPQLEEQLTMEFESAEAWLSAH